RGGRRLRALLFRAEVAERLDDGVVLLGVGLERLLFVAGGGAGGAHLARQVAQGGAELDVGALLAALAEVLREKDGEADADDAGDAEDDRLLVLDEERHGLRAELLELVGGLELFSGQFVGHRSGAHCAPGMALSTTYERSFRCLRSGLGTEAGPPRRQALRDLPVAAPVVDEAPVEAVARQ